MAEERENVFQARLDKVLNFLFERGFSRELRQEQRCSVKTAALLKRRSTRCAPHRIWEKSDFSSFSTYERRLCYPRIFAN